MYTISQAFLKAALQDKSLLFQRGGTFGTRADQKNQLRARAGNLMRQFHANQLQNLEVVSQLSELEAAERTLKQFAGREGVKSVLTGIEETRKRLEASQLTLILQSRSLETELTEAVGRLLEMGVTIAELTAERRTFRRLSIQLVQSNLWI